MKKFLILSVTIGVVLLLLNSCYKDKGVYDYHDINDIIVELPESKTISLPLVDSIMVEIVPQVSQVFIEGEDNLRYLWEKVNTAAGNNGEWPVCGREKVCKYWVKATDSGSARLRLTITDTIENIKVYREIVLRYVESYSQCWFVLQNIDGQSVLGAVDGSGSSRNIYQNVYGKNAQNFTGTPVCLAVNNNHIRPGQDYPQASNPECILQVMTSNNGYQLDLKNLSVRYPYNLMLIQKPGSYHPTYAISDCAGEIILDNGEGWFAIPNGLSIYYPVRLSQDLGSSYRATMASVINSTYCFIFDDANKRFMYYENSDLSADWWNQKKIRGGDYSLYDANNSLVNGKTLQPIGENTTAPNEFDPNNIGGDKKVVYMGATTDTEASKCMALATSGNAVYVYEFSIKGFSNADIKRCSYHAQFTPVGDVNECKFATSSYFDRMFFYASGNKIYRVDLNRAQPEGFVIYEHPDPKAKFTNLRFLSNRKDFGRWISEEVFEYFHVNKILGGVIENADGTSSLLEMDLTGGGEVKLGKDGKPIVYKFDGFKNVVDIAYVYK